MSAELRSPATSAEKERRPLVIGLTGPIASGKSTVAALLRSRGAEIINADAVYRSLLTPGSELWQRVVERFGSAILQPDDEIDRAQLGAIVFQDEAALADLERLTHPAVVAEIRRQIAVARSSIVAIEAVKLTQAGLLADVDSLWLVTADPEIRLRRLVARNGLDETRARARLAASADVVPPSTPVDVNIDNSGEMSETARAVDEAWRTLTTQFPCGVRATAVAANRPEEGA